TPRRKDVNAASFDAVGDGPVVSAGRFFFTAKTSDAGTELYVTDGTAAGTGLLRDIVPGPESSYPGSLTDVNGTLFYVTYTGPGGAAKDLWKTDGTPEGTMLVKAGVVSVPGSGGVTPPLMAAGGTLFFSGQDAAHGSELWKSDGTEAGTVLVKDIRPGPAGAGAGLVAALGNSVLFWAGDGVHGAELWRSDGTEAGTVF